MRVGMLAIVLLLAGCAGSRLPAAIPVQAPVVTPAAGGMSQTEVASEVARLHDAFDREVPERARDGGAEATRAWVRRATSALALAQVTIDRPQLVVVVDRNPAVQQLRIILAQSQGPWQVIGGSSVSTGQAGRRGYFITPVGVFPHTDAILDYRAQGTFNANHIRGLGLKGMRVWDFGWQTAEQGWRSDGDTSEIRMEMHATDPDYLEQRLGQPASEGCVRVPATMNRFLDLHGVLDADYERAAYDDVRFASVLLPDRQPTPLAGNLLVVIDSSQAG